jgi:hypothetical protein
MAYGKKYCFFECSPKRFLSCENLFGEHSIKDIFYAEGGLTITKNLNEDEAAGLIFIQKNYNSLLKYTL